MATVISVIEAVGGLGFLVLVGLCSMWYQLNKHRKDIQQIVKQ